MKNKLIVIFSLILFFSVFSLSIETFAQSLYEIHNDLKYPVTVDLYRIYWEKDLESKPVFIESIRLNPNQKHTCNFSESNDQDIKSYQYRIQFKTTFYIKEVDRVFSNILKTTTSSIIEPDKQHIGLYKIPSLY